MGAPKEKLYELIDQLPESERETAERFLKFLINESNRRIIKVFEEAPTDDEPLTEEDLKNIEEAKKELEIGEVESWDQIKQEMGLCD